ncbi:MAG: PDZ domain-containing protein, partial [Cocleimonas sp.]|nr:PDZ domain-containing protein [Cocleimonas sp.]
MNNSAKLLLAMTALMMATSTQAEQSGFITPEQSASLFNKQEAKSTKQPSAVGAPNKEINATETKIGYLGIGFDKIPLSIRTHLPANISQQQGLIVTRFADNSPAADDGMKVHDVLLTYNGQAIGKPENFIKIIRNDKPGQKVMFTLLRQGQILTVPVTMGAQKKKKPARSTLQAQYPTSLPSQSQQRLTGKAPPNTNYNGLAIRKISKDIYDASIGFTGQDGKPTRRSYKGNRMQILQQIMQARDLPPQARQQLLFAVQPKQKQNSGWGGMPNMPFGNNN